MIIAQAVLKAKAMYGLVVETLQKHLSLKTEGWKCRTEQSLNLLVKAVASGSSLEATCQDSCGVLSSKRLREQLNAALDVADLRYQEIEMNQALASAIPKEMPRGGLEVAIDTHDEPFYGKGAELLSYTCRSQAKDGTSHFFRIASAYVIWRDVRLTLALVYVLPEDDLAAVLERLLQSLSRLGMHSYVLYLDKGFCNGTIIKLLQQRGQATILACPIRGKSGGIRALCQGRGSKTVAYTFSDGTAVTLVLVASCRPQKGGQKRRKWLAFVLVNLNWTPPVVYKKYRRRFGIECSYRILRQAKVFTNTRNPALRFFLFGLSLLIQNLWGLVRWLCTRCPSKGRHKLIPSLLRFERFCKFLVRAVEDYYPPPDSIEVFALLVS
jgi:putative transposase